MQIVYATHLPLPQASDLEPLDTAVTALSAWLRHRFSVNVDVWRQGSASADGVRVEWKSMTGTAGGLVTLFIDQRDRLDPNWRWKTFVDVGVEDKEAWMRVRVGLYSPLEGLLTRPRVQAGRPGLVRAMADQLKITIDGWQIGEWRTVARNQVDAYVAFLRDDARQLPVVALSATEDSGEPFVDPAHLADRLLGLAHVVSIEPNAGYEVSDRIGRGLSCYFGAVRVYWPGFKPTDDPYHHRLFVGRTLDYLGREGLETELFEQLGRLAGLSLDEPRLRQRLRIEERAAEIEARVADRAEAGARLAATSSANDGGLTADEFTAFSEEFEQMRKQVDDLEWGVLDSEIEVGRLRDERDEARATLLQLVKEFEAAKGVAPELTVPDAPQTVAEAVERATAECEHLTILEEALQAARESTYPDPSRVLDDLKVLDEVARDWAAGELASGPTAALEQRCSNFRKGISDTAVQQYGVDYRRSYKGEEIILGPHLRRGVGAVASILRIYFYFDAVDRVIVVGHVGRKLRDSSNRN